MTDETAPKTLEDVAQQIDVVCSDYVNEVRRVKARYEADVEQFCAKFDHLPDNMDVNAVMSIVTGRVKRMLTEIQAVAAE